jgi:hypothetical protein
VPSIAPSVLASVPPLIIPSETPSTTLSSSPSEVPSIAPSVQPSVPPSKVASTSPSSSPTAPPSLDDCIVTTTEQVPEGFKACEITFNFVDQVSVPAGLSTSSLASNAEALFFTYHCPSCGYTCLKFYFFGGGAAKIVLFKGSPENACGTFLAIYTERVSSGTPGTGCFIIAIALESGSPSGYFSLYAPGSCPSPAPASPAPASPAPVIWSFFSNNIGSAVEKCFILFTTTLASQVFKRSGHSSVIT